MFIKRKILDTLQQYDKGKEAIVITGLRRVGKTKLLEYLFEQTDSINKLILDLESPVNQKIFIQDNYDSIMASLSHMGLDLTSRAYVFIDEIQNVRHIPSVVKYLYDHYDVKFYLTGSSSFYLKNLFSESLAGRKLVFELFPLDFEEFLWFKSSKVSIHASYDHLSGLYEEYLLFGGFPSVVLENSFEKKKFRIDEILGSYFQIDVATLAHFRDVQNLKKLIFLLATRVGSKPDITKLADVLSVSRQTVYEYLDFFEGTYFIHTVRPFSGSSDIQIRSIPKIYFCDTGILNQIGDVAKGTLFENKVFNQCFTRFTYERDRSIFKDKIFYYQKKSGAEIDFITERNSAYEVKLTASNYDVKKLGKICRKLQIPDYHVVSLEKVEKENDHIIYPYAL